MKKLIPIAIAVALLILANYYINNSRKIDRILKGIPEKEKKEPLLLDTDDAKTIALKSFKAHGGDEALERWRCGEIQYESSGGVIPKQMSIVSFSDIFQFPGFFKRVVTFNIANKNIETTYVINRNDFWSKSTGPIPNNASQVPPNIAEHPFVSLVNLSYLFKPGVELTRLENCEINENRTVHILAKSVGQADFHYFFDQESGFLYVFSKKAILPHEKEPVIIKMYYSSYRDIQGYPYPMLFSGRKNDVPFMEVKIKSLRFSDQYDESVFAKP